MPMLKKKSDKNDSLNVLRVQMSHFIYEHVVLHLYYYCYLYDVVSRLPIV